MLYRSVVFNLTFIIAVTLWCVPVQSADVSLNQLKQQASDTQQKWQRLQQALTVIAETESNTSSGQGNLSDRESLINKLRDEYQHARTEELIIFDRLVKKEAEIDYQQYLAKREFEVDYLHQCERMSSNKQCEEKARLEVLNKAGKEGSSIVINSTTDITTTRTEAETGIESSSHFQENTNMRSYANIVSYQILESYQKKTNTRYERLWFIKILVYVSAKENPDLYQQLIDKHKQRFELYLSANAILQDVNVNQPMRFIERVGVNKIVMIKIPSGEFFLGSEQGDYSEKPVLVKQVNGFYMSETEVTKGLYQQCVKSKICKAASRFQDKKLTNTGLNQPQINVSFDDIEQDFLPWLTLKTGKTYRLPTEIEWEFAAKAGSETDYYYGNKVSDICYYANGAQSQYTNENCDDGYRKMVAPVKQFRPNNYGLYDMLGNVSEWTSSCWSLYNNPNLNCRQAVIRGGSWYDKPFYLRSASRNSKTKHTRLDTLGFRLVYSN